MSKELSPEGKKEKAMIAAMKLSKKQIKENREIFLAELRSGKYKKGTLKSDEKGKPVINTPEDDNGSCACAIMCHLFGQTPSGKLSSSQASKALGLNSNQCRYIQQNLNDTDLSFTQIARIIHAVLF